MTIAWAVVLFFAVGMSVLFWVVWVWMVLHLRSSQRRGIKPTRTQVEARDWPAAIALGFTGLAVVAWLVG